MFSLFDVCIIVNGKVLASLSSSTLHPQISDFGHFLMYRNCCLPTCTSLRRDVKLHRFPSREEKKRQWLKIINCKSIMNSDVRKLYVCHKHFERRFINAATNHLKSGAYPSLFTPTEISLGTPTTPTSFCLKPDIKTDHKHPRKPHIDHSYVLPIEQPYKHLNTDDIDIEMIPSTVQNISTNCIVNLNLKGSPEPATADSTHEKTHSDDGAVDADEAAARFAFSWEKPYDAIPCADESDSGGDSSSVRSCAGSDDNEIKLETHNDKLHLNFKCNECGGEIIGYRYTCVQCLAVDLCGACEAGGAHPAHYVLRLPRPEPAGAAKGVLETLRGLLDHEPPLHLPRDRIKMELDDEDPLYEPTGLRSPEPTRDESDDYESEEEKSDFETLSTASKETHTDAVVANTAQTHHQTHETATSVVKVSGPVKKKILPIRLRKPTLVKTLLVDSGAIKFGARVGPGQVGVARTGMGTGVGIPGAGVTGPGGGVRVAGDLERVSEASERLTGPDVKVSRAGIVVPGTEGMVSIPAPKRPVVVKLKRLEATLPEEAKMRKIYFDTTPSKKLS